MQNKIWGYKEIAFVNWQDKDKYLILSCLSTQLAALQLVI